MTIYYAKSTNGFYDSAINAAATIPSDAVEITEATRQSLLAAQSAGKRITADVSGNPVAVDPLTLLTLPQVQAAQSAALSAACAAAIVGGFSSSALGSAHTYPSQPNDQSNLIGAATVSQAPGLPSTWTCNFWCVDSTGAWALRSHTAAQIQQVLADGLAAREALSTKLAGLVAQVQAAATTAAVQAIVWS